MSTEFNFRWGRLDCAIREDRCCATLSDFKSDEDDCLLSDDWELFVLFLRSDAWTIVDVELRYKLFTSEFKSDYWLS